MNESISWRQEAGAFLNDTLDDTGSWRVMKVYASPEMGHTFDVVMFKWGSRQVYWRIYAYGTADFSIRPPNPATIEGGPEIRFLTDDPRLGDPMLQNIPGGDGEIYNPPRRYQLLELDQSWIIAEQFEIGPLPQSS